MKTLVTLTCNMMSRKVHLTRILWLLIPALLASLGLVEARLGIGA